MLKVTIDEEIRRSGYVDKLLRFYRENKMDYHGYAKFIDVSALSRLPISVRYLSWVIGFIVSFVVEVVILIKYDLLTFQVLFSISILLLISIVILMIRMRGSFRNTPFYKLYCLIYDNHLYEKGFILNSLRRSAASREKSVITNSIKFSYKKVNDELIVRVWKMADCFTDKANKQDSMLSALFGIEISKKIDTVTYCDYVFSLIQDERLDFKYIDNLSERELIRMTKKISWRMGKPPHTLIVGGTNSGKTSLVSDLVLKYLYMEAQIYIADPKNADLAMIGRIIDLKKNRETSCTATSENEIARLLRSTTEEMDKRYSKFFSDANAIGKTWRDFKNVKPIVIIFDEYSAFVSVSSPKVIKEVNGYLYSLILKGRQAGIEVVCIMQRPDASILSGNIRDQFGVRIGLGNLSPEGRKMIFGNNNGEFKTIVEMGGGYILIDGQTHKPNYFETPIIPGGRDYLDELNKAIEGNQPLTVLPFEVGD